LTTSASDTQPTATGLQPHPRLTTREE
jgi:hypothetical protein